MNDDSRKEDLSLSGIKQLPIAKCYVEVAKYWYIYVKCYILLVDPKQVKAYTMFNFNERGPQVTIWPRDTVKYIDYIEDTKNEAT